MSGIPAVVIFSISTMGILFWGAVSGWLSYSYWKDTYNTSGRKTVEGRSYCRSFMYHAIGWTISTIIAIILLVWIFDQIWLFALKPWIMSQGQKH